VDERQPFFHLSVYGQTRLRGVYLGGQPMILHEVFHQRKNRSFILAAVVILAINTGVSIDCLAQTQPPVPDTGAPHLSESELISATRQKLAQDTASDRFAGAVLIAHNGKPVFAQAYGLADREHKVPNTIKTRFHIGSMNKMFTAVAIVHLAQQGKLGLDRQHGSKSARLPVCRPYEN
jgi:CubicO group peptidase (beta-lactamase class C family)